MNKIRNGDILESVTITDAASEGMGIARQEGLVLFVERGVPGDVADIRVFRNKKNFAEASILKLQKPSEHRVDPPCEHFGICGGCKWQMMEYGQQLFYKQKQVEDVLQRVGKVELPVVSPIIGSAKTEFYRNRLDFTFSNKRWLTKEEKEAGVSPEENVIGFHVPQRFDKILDIRKCFLQDELTNTIRNGVRNFANENHFSFNDVTAQEGYLRNLVLRSSTTGEWMVIVVFRSDEKESREKIMNYIAGEFPQVTSLLYMINPKKNDTLFDLDVHVFKGHDHITEQMEGYRFKISAKSFYQTNSLQAYELYKAARSFAELRGTELVYDLYTGTGTIACFVSKQARHVIGIDYIPDAILDAQENAKNNNVNNVSFFAGDIKNTLNDSFISEHGKPDVIITDPPRSGMHEAVVKKIVELEPARVVYVSCNPSTQARDINLMSEKYVVEKLQPVDMFPHTTHVENVALLKLKNQP
ncbi:MAG: 23S rRNA (uracil(1939)-C(5))-methyltransferase RlmD [Bacteroidetes bacterium]|nr:23S rRNA (uracil(1939)-C(5))-methyltransferase RlmD [Bacteroidota bacterium]